MPIAKRREFFFDLEMWKKYKIVVWKEEHNADNEIQANRDEHGGTPLKG